MISLLAQAAPPAGLDAWLASSFYIIGLITAVVVLWKHMRPRPSGVEIAGQPITIQGVMDYTPLVVFQKLEARVNTIDDQIRAGFDRLDSKRSQSVAALHDDLERSITDLRKEVKDDIGGVQDRINDVARAISRVEGQLQK